jgi:hypothetical protein
MPVYDLGNTAAQWKQRHNSEETWTCGRCGYSVTFIIRNRKWNCSSEISTWWEEDWVLKRAACNVSGKIPRDMLFWIAGRANKETSSVTSYILLLHKCLQAIRTRLSSVVSSNLCLFESWLRPAGPSQAFFSLFMRKPLKRFKYGHDCCPYLPLRHL